MGTPVLFKFSLRNKQGKYYYLDAGGAVQLSDTEKFLKDTPANWSEIELKFGRDEKYFGIFRKAAMSLQFRGDGATILRSIYYANDGANFNAYCLLNVKKRYDGEEEIWPHRDYYSAEVDFAESFVDGEDGRGLYVSASLLEKGLPQIIEDKLNTPYEIDLGSDAKVIKVNGLNLSGNYEYVAADLPLVNLLDGGQRYVPPMGLAVSEGEEYFSQTFFFSSQGLEVYTALVPSESNKFLYADKTLAANYSLQMSIDAATIGSVGTTLTVNILKKLTGTTTGVSTNLFNSGSFTGTQTFNINTSGTYTFDPINFTYYLIIVTTSVSGGSSTDVTINNLRFNVNFQYEFQATSVKAYPYQVVFEKLINLMTGGAYSFTSGYLNYKPNKTTELARYGNYNGAPGYTYITCGDAIRGQSVAKIKVTLAELLQDCWGRWMTGASSLNDVFQVQKLGVLFQRSSVIFTCEEAKGVKKTTATNFLYNQLKVGYPDPDVDQLNGRFEINSEQTWKMPITQGEEMDLSSPFKASIYDIEQIRINLKGVDTTNDKRDNSVYLIEADFDGTDITPIRYQSPNLVFGVPDGESVYNIGLSPKRFILRHLPYIRSILNCPDGVASNPGKITFQEGLKNTNANTFIDNKYIEEGADIFPGLNLDGTLQDRLFKPMIYEFTTVPPSDLLQKIEANPFGLIGFPDNGVIKYGFILDVGIKPARNDTYNFRLLAYT